MMGGQLAGKDACGPCLSEKQIKKAREQDLKELKATINGLAKLGHFSNEAAVVVGGLVIRMIQQHGPLK